jgi:hypothetical protein
MRMDVGGVRVGEQPRDGRLKIAFDEVGVDHAARDVEGAQRDRADSQHLGNLVHGSIRRLGPFTDENGVARFVDGAGELERGAGTVG